MGAPAGNGCTFRVNLCSLGIVGVEANIGRPAILFSSILDMDRAYLPAKIIRVNGEIESSSSVSAGAERAKPACFGISLVGSFGDGDKISSTGFNHHRTQETVRNFRSGSGIDG